MIGFVQTPLAGAALLDIEPKLDARGFFARTYCEQEFGAAGISAPISQCSISYNIAKHTLRGLHFQKPPYAEEKIVRCTSGSIFDVIVDIRPGSPTVGKWFGVELSSQSRRAIFIPKGFAHGFLTLSEHVEVLYMMSVPFVAEAAAGIRWNDPQLGIGWPAVPAVISERDASYPLLPGVEAWRV